MNEPSLRPLHDRVQAMVDEFEQSKIKHIPREQNWKANELVDKAFSD